MHKYTEIFKKIQLVEKLENNMYVKSENKWAEK